MSKNLRKLPNKNTNLPRERLQQKGPEALSDIELLAIILGSGSKKTPVLALATKLLKKHSLKQVLEQEIEQLIQFKSIGNVKAISLKAVYEISKRINYETTTTRTKVSSAKDIYKITRKDFVGKKQEQIILISLDARERLISKDLISIGTLNEALFPTREIIKTALLKNAASIVLVHNHPSQDPTPSREDVQVTKTIAKACELNDIGFFDHVVVTDQDYFSIKKLNVLKVQNLKGGE